MAINASNTTVKVRIWNKQDRVSFKHLRSVWLQFERAWTYVTLLSAWRTDTDRPWRFPFFYILYWTPSFRCHRKWWGRMASKRSTIFGMRAGWRRRLALTRYRARGQDANSPRKHTWRTHLQDRIISGLVAGSSDEVCERSQKDHRRAPAREARRMERWHTRSFSKMSAEIKQRWCCFKNADRWWLRIFFRNVVCKVQDDGCRRGCCDGREPETFSMA